MSNPFDQFDAPAAEGGNPFDQFDAPAAKKLPSKGILSDVGGAFVEGAKSAGRAIAGTANIYAGDESALVEKAQAQESAQAQKPAALTAFNQAVTERVKPLGDDPGLLDSVKAIGGAVVDQPKGAGLAVVEQLPNAAPAIAGGLAGMKAGTALGTAIMPGVGTTIGAIGGGLAGMFLGNTAIETGYKGIEAAQDGAVTQDEMSRVKKEGAVKAGVITGVDALTLGLSKAVTNIPARAVESATRNALTKAGVNVADEAAVLAARQSPEISAAVRAAQESAFASANTLGKRAAAGGAALGLETVGEGLGEYLGELAATGKANVADAVLEAMMSLGQSGAEVAWGAARNKKAEQGGMWDTAEAKFQPPPPTLVTEPEPLQQRIDALMGIDTGAMSDKERTQYEKDLTAAFLEPVGVTQDEHGLEIPFTMADYLNAQVRAEDSVRARPLKQNAADQSGNRLQQLADEETQQQPDIPGYVAPEIPVVGTLSAMANMAIQSGAHKQSQMQQAMQAAVEKQKSTSEGSSRAAQPEQMAAQAPQANDAQAPAFDVSTRTEGQLSYLAQNGQPGWKEAATAELVRLNGATAEQSSPVANEQQAGAGLPAPSAGDSRPAPVADGAELGAVFRDWVAKNDRRVSAYPGDEQMAAYEREASNVLAGKGQLTSKDDFERFMRLRAYGKKFGFDLTAAYKAFDNGQDIGPDGGLKIKSGANQVPIKNASPTAATVPAETVAPNQEPIKNEDQPASADPALQNRDRGRAASVNQMQSIARNPDYMRLGPSRTPDSGAPMVFAVGNDTQKISPANFGANDTAVMSDGQRVPFRYAVVDASQVQPSNFADGATNPEFASTNQGTIKALNNGRTAGVRSAHSSGNAATYTAELLADNAHGVSPEAIRNTPNPMLVRVYAEQSNTVDMAAKSQGQGLGMSASERATQDAELMTSDVLDKFAPGDIASAGNRDFVRAFVGKLAENELADMMDATGNLSQDGRRRIEAALLTAAYGKSDLVQELFESTDTDIKAIGNALKVMSGQWAAMRNAAKDGVIDPDTDMTANLIEAVNIVRRSRAEGSSIAELAGQGDLMGGNYLNVLSEGFLRILYKGKNYDRARGGDKVIAALQEIVTSAMNTKAEAGLFGDSFKATPKQIVESARSKIDEENKPASQSSLFGANGQATAVSQGNNGEGAAQSGEVGQRPIGTGRSEETGKQAEPVERSISDLQKELESAKFGERTELNGILIERVSEDAERSIKQGEMPMYQTGQGTFVALHPSAQQDGMIQVTRYTKDGVIGDSQYNSIDEAVRFEGLTHKPRIPSNEAIAHIENSIAAEAEYQKRKNEQQAGAGLPASTAGGSRPAPAVRSDSSLNKTASWVIRNKATGEVVMETYDKAKVDALNTEKYEAVPIQDYLGSLNAKSDADTRFAKNTIFTADKVAAAKARMKAKLGTMNSGIDPELLIDGMTIAGAYIESGVRKFADYAKAMVSDLGDGVKPYLLSFYEAARAYPGLNKIGMDSQDVAASLHRTMLTQDVLDKAKEVVGESPKVEKKKPANLFEAVRLKADWGVRNIDGYTRSKTGKNQETDYGLKGGVKDEFLADAKRYLKAVSKLLEDQGFETHVDNRGKGIAAVNSNEAGPAVSGDAYLRMNAGDFHVFAQVGVSSVRGIGPAHPQGVSLMVRAGQKNGMNNWLPLDLSAGDLADWFAKRLAIANANPAPTMEAKDTNGVNNADAIQPENLPGTVADRNQGDVGHGNRDSKPLASGVAEDRQGADSDGRVSGRPEGAGSAGNQGQAGQQHEPSVELGKERGDGAERSPADADASGKLDHVIDAEDIGKGGLTKKYSDNIAAIKIIKAMEAEGRAATPEERKQIARYAGWGAIKGVFDPANKQWAKQHEELKSLLTDAEFAAARKSTLNAHYTSPVAVGAMYSALERLGFTGGRVLEPSVGVGNFFGLMPAKLRNASNLHGVELDSLTSRLVAALYPKANIAQSTGFQDFDIPAEFFDAVIGNPPFGSEPIVDMNRSPYSGFSIHNYFLAKSIDKLRPGGIMEVVVSHSFLDSQDERARQWIADRASLIGGVRFPNTAFKENAGTEVVTDILIFQKKTEAERVNGLNNDHAPWVKAVDQQNTNPKTGETATHKVSEFFADNPDLVLGRPSAAGSMYSANEYTVEATGDIKPMLEAWVKTLPENIFTPIDRSSDRNIVDMEIPDGIKPGSFYVDKNGAVMRRGDDVMGNKTAAPFVAKSMAATARMKGMIGLRDLLRQQMRLERSADSSEAEIEANRAKLNTAYDDFLKKFGHLNSVTNRNVFMDDTESQLLQALEFDFDKGISAATAEREEIEPKAPSAKKADIFQRRVMFPPSDFMKVTSAKDALLASLNYRGKVDLDYMGEVYSKSPDETVKELGDVLFDDPQSGLVMADEYLSGDVKTKLAEAKDASLSDAKYRRNVEALEKIIPEDKKPSEISVSIGASFIPSEIYEQFIQHITGGGAKLAYLKSTGQWLIDYVGAPDTTLNSGTFGTSHLSARELFGLSMMGRGAVVKQILRNPDGSTTTVVLEKETEAAREKQNAIKNEWQKWLWNDAERADKVASIYNDKMNRIVERKFDGSHLTFPGMNPAISLLEHQKNGVWRGLQSFQVLYDHVVGAGKTFEMATLAMEMRRLGIARKPLFVVPNHLTLQWRNEFTRLYPGSNILAATPEDFSKENRGRMFSKIVTGDWDAVILGHSSLKKIGLPEETEKAVLEEQITEISDAIEETKRNRGDRNIIRDMEGIKSRLEAKMKDKLAAIGKRDKVLTFDELGVDALFIDEMHEFKNLSYNSTMDRNPGMGNPAGSAKAFDLFVKTRWLFDTFGEKTPFITATGTPVSNSLVEMFNMQRYMQYPTLKRENLHVFDAWAKQFGSVENVYEVAPSGSGFRQSTRFAKFTNLPALMSLYNSFADTITLDDLRAQEEAQGKRFPVPKIAGGKPTLVVAQRSPMVAERMGVPRAVLDDAGKVTFAADLDKPVEIAKQETGKWAAKVGDNHLGFFETEEEAKLRIVEKALAPNVAVAPESILGRFANLKQLTKETKGKVNALSLTGEANKAGLDFRLIDPSAPDFAGSKINLAVDNLLRTYHQWSKDKGTQLVFCDMSIPLSARSNFSSKERRLYVRDDAGALVMKRGTLHAADGFESLPFFIVAKGDKAGKRFEVYDAATGFLVGGNFTSRVEAKERSATLIESETSRQRWLDKRLGFVEITQDLIDEYNNENSVETEGIDAFGPEDIAGISGSAKFSVYDDIKAKLMARGVPEREIAFIHDYSTPVAKAKLFKAVNDGDVRFLLGSTPKMGAGTNVQERLVGLHHIDAPWRPSDLEQREGRIIRRGNKLYERNPEGFEVFIGRYATEQTYDTRRWQILEHKARGIEQLRNFDGTTNEIEDIDGEAANAADMKAAASGDPLILEETKLRNEVKRLERLQDGHADEKVAMERKASSQQKYAEEYGPAELKMIRGLMAEAAKYPADKKGFSPVTISGNKFSDAETATKEIAGTFAAVRSGFPVATVTFRGQRFTFSKPYGETVKVETDIGTMGLWSPNEAFSASGFIQRMINHVDRLAGHEAHILANIEKAKDDVVKLREQAKQPFQQDKDLETARAEHSRVRRALMAKGPSVPDSQRAMVDAAIEAQKDRLRAMGFGQAVDEMFANQGSGNVAERNASLSPADTAIYGMATEGKSAAEILKFIVSASRNPLNRQIAKLLLKTGIAPRMTVGTSDGWKFNAGNDKKYAAAYNPKANTVALFRPASAERHVLHELMHAATLKALNQKGLAAIQMKALFAHVKKTGELNGMYGMSDVDEFVAEAFTNPKFQEALKKIAAPSASSSIKSGWHWFVRIVRGILGMPQEQENALSQALDIGIGVMRENMRLNEGSADVRYNAAPGKINQTDTEAFRKWFGDSKVVDSDGNPMLAYHGTGATDINEFKVSERGTYGGGIYLTPDLRGANDYAIYRGAPSSTVYPVYVSIKNPASGSEAAQVASWKGEENAREELIRRGFDGVVDMRSGEIVAFYPEQIKSAIGNNGDFDGSNPDIRYNVADEGWSITEPSKIDDVIYALQDKQIDMKRVVQSIMKTGKQIKDNFNAYLQEELFHGRAAKGVKDFLDFELRPLLADMQKAGVDMGDFEEYLWNRHAEERNKQIAKINPDMPDGGSGIETAKARAYLAGLSAEQRKTFEALAAKVEAMNRESQRVLIESGLEKQSTIDAWNGAYQHYVPLQREDVDSGHVGTGKGFSVRGSSTKRAMGSGRQVVDIIANLTMQRERNIVRAEKNRVSNALLGLAVQNPNPDFWKVDQAPKERVVEETAIYTVRDESGKKLDEFTRMDEAERFARQHPGSDIEQTWGDRVKERVTPGFTSRDNVLLTRINGEDHYVIFNERDERAVRMAMSMKNLDVDNMGRVLSVVGKATRYLASVNTQYNPVFGVINLIRDAQGALINLTSTPLAGEQKRVLGYTVDALRGIYADIRAHRKGEKPSSKWAALFEEFQKEGGQTGYRDQYANSEARAEAIKSELEQFKEGKAKQFTRGIFGWLSDYNETMENAVRLAAYKAAKEKGMSNQQAASLAKNITVNFNRKGQMATQVGALYAFFNASVQGTARIAETLFEQRGGELKNVRLSKVGKKIVAGGIMLGSMQAMLLAAAGFDDDEPPEFIRERNLILPIGDGKYLTMAMPLGFHVIPGIGRIATEFVLSGGKDPIKRIAAFGSMFADAFNPVGSAGWSLQTITPSVVDPFAALAENKDFTGKEIYREDFNKLNPTPGHARAKDVATIWSRYISEAMNFMTGGTEFKPGMFSPSPDSIDYLLGQLTGGVGREVNKAFQTGSAASTGEDLPLYKIPLVGRFVGDTEGQGGQSAKFYEAIKQINMHEAEYKGLLKEGRRQEAAAYLAENPAVKLILAGNHAELTLRKLRSQKRDLVEKDADKEQVRAIDERITATMRKFNERAGVVI